MLFIRERSLGNAMQFLVGSVGRRKVLFMVLAYKYVRYVESLNVISGVYCLFNLTTTYYSPILYEKSRPLQISSIFGVNDLLNIYLLYF